MHETFVWETFVKFRQSFINIDVWKEWIGRKINMSCNILRNSQDNSFTAAFLNNVWKINLCKSCRSRNNAEKNAYSCCQRRRYALHCNDVFASGAPSVRLFSVAFTSCWQGKALVLVASLERFCHRFWRSFLKQGWIWWYTTSAPTRCGL